MKPDLYPWVDEHEKKGRFWSSSHATGAAQEKLRASEKELLATNGMSLFVLHGHTHTLKKGERGGHGKTLGV